MILHLFLFIFFYLFLKFLLISVHLCLHVLHLVLVLKLFWFKSPIKITKLLFCPVLLLSDFLVSVYFLFFVESYHLISNLFELLIKIILLILLEFNIHFLFIEFCVNFVLKLMHLRSFSFLSINLFLLILEICQEFIIFLNSMIEIIDLACLLLLVWYHCCLLLEIYTECAQNKHT